jgi:hypothetical protein
MAETDNVVLEHLRHIRGAVDGLRDDMREVKSRLGLLESQYGNLSIQYASLSLASIGLTRVLKGSSGASN